MFVKAARPTTWLGPALSCVGVHKAAQANAVSDHRMRGPSISHATARAPLGLAPFLGPLLICGFVTLCAVPEARGDDAGNASAAVADAPDKSGTTVAETRRPDRSHLAPGDRLTITVFDQPDLSGVYLIEPAGTINMALLGAVPSSGISAEALQRELTARLGADYLQNPTVSVRLAELRPVTVVGGVRAPGRYAFIDGLNVGALLAMTGGVAAGTDDELRRRTETLAARERLDAARIAHLGQTVRRARLEAQLAGVALDHSPEGPVSALFTSILAVEQRILDAAIDARRRRQAAFEEQGRQIGADIQTFEEQIALETTQLASLDAQIADATKLLNNGLTRKSVVNDLEREKGRARVNLSTLLGNKARSRSLLAESSLRLEELESAARSALVAELQTINIEIALSEAALPSLAEALSLQQSRDPAALRSPAAPPAIIRITRYEVGERVVRTVDVDEEIWPGDIVDVDGDASAAGSVSVATSFRALGTPGAPGAQARAGVATDIR